jgi:hypothetical protein
MTAVTLPITAAGALIDALVSVSPARERALAAAGYAIPGPVAVRTLVDIGASCTCIDPAIAGQLSLSPTGASRMLTAATGTSGQPCNQYDIALTVLMANRQPHPIPLVIAAIDAHLAPHGFQLILGRDVLAFATLFYKARSFTLTF